MHTTVLSLEIHRTPKCVGLSSLFEPIVLRVRVLWYQSDTPSSTPKFRADAFLLSVGREIPVPYDTDRALFIYFHLYLRFDESCTAGNNSPINVQSMNGTGSDDKGTMLS